MGIREILAANPDLDELSKRFSAEQVRQYKEAQRKKKSAEATSVQVTPVPPTTEDTKKKEKV